jgi:hypothetical protein
MLGYNPAVSAAQPDGDCAIHSINISLTGGEQTGRYALRLRMAVYLAIQIESIKQRCGHHPQEAAFFDKTEEYVADAFQPHAHLGRLHLAALSGALNCPIISLHPGHRGPSASNFLIQPLGQPLVSH